MTQWTRRGFLAAAGVTGLAVAVGCSPDNSGADLNSGEVKIRHAFGETVIPAPPQRVVSAGFTEQDDLLAVGTVPVATTEWWGGEPFAVWPWAQAALGGARPAVLSLADGIDVDAIAALRPDLIVAMNAGCDAETYERLSQIAPTLPQVGGDPFFGPWKEQAAAIGRAVFAGDRMTQLIAGVDERFTAVGTAHPEFEGRTAVLLQGTVWDDSVIATLPGWRTEFLTQMGLVVPDGLAEFARDDDRAFIPLDEVGSALADDAVLIWTTESDEERAALLADPRLAGLEPRSVFTARELAGALAFKTVLSWPVVAEQLPPLLVPALR